MGTLKLTGLGGEEVTDGIDANGSEFRNCSERWCGGISASFAGLAVAALEVQDGRCKSSVLSFDVNGNKLSLRSIRSVVSSSTDDVV